MDAAVGVDDIVIADVVPAEALVVSSYGFHGAVGIGTGSGAMDDDFGDLSHCLMGFMGLMGLMGCNDITAYATIAGIDWIERGLGWILAPALSGLVRV